MNLHLAMITPLMRVDRLRCDGKDGANVVTGVDGQEDLACSDDGERRLGASGDAVNAGINNVDVLPVRELESNHGAGSAPPAYARVLFAVEITVMAKDGPSPQLIRFRYSLLVVN
jgi:hypothetical protein